MTSGPALENLTAAIGEACRSGRPPEALRDEVLPRLDRAVPFDAAFWATTDPGTLLFTQAHQQALPRETIPAFLANEFGGEDANPFAELAVDAVGVGTLAAVTGGVLERSARHNEILAPLGLGDELRAVLRRDGAVWGVLCLHRAAGRSFTAEESRYVQRISPLLADGIRHGLLVASVEMAPTVETPGLVLLAAGGEVISVTGAGSQWLDELGDGDLAPDGLPPVVLAVAARLDRAPDGGGVPRLRMRTRTGRWAVLHAARLPGVAGDVVAVIIEEPSPAELAPVLMLAYGLTPREREIACLACRGRSTKQIAAELQIATNTVQQHLTSVFDKTGVRSRRELVSTLMHDQYMPRAIARQRAARSGTFDR
jgi:DNA-binding CsgD family transcriptional regulator